MRGIVAFVASQPSMLAFENVSGVFVIESLGIPFHQRKIFPVMFRVATRAFLARTCRDVVRRVQSPVRCDPAGNFGVTLETLQGRLAAELVATGAVR